MGGFNPGASFEEQRALMHKMRDEGRPIDTRDEYMAFAESDGDYSAVVRLRIREICMKRFKQVDVWRGVMGEG